MKVGNIMLMTRRERGKERVRETEKLQVVNGTFSGKGRKQKKRVQMDFLRLNSRNNNNEV